MPHRTSLVAAVETFFDRLPTCQDVHWLVALVVEILREGAAKAGQDDQQPLFVLAKEVKRQGELKTRSQDDRQRLCAVIKTMSEHQAYLAYQSGFAYSWGWLSCRAIQPETLAKIRQLIQQSGDPPWLVRRLNEILPPQLCSIDPDQSPRRGLFQINGDG